MSLAHATRPTRLSRSSYFASGLLLLATVVGGVRATALLTADDDPQSLQFAGATWTVTDVAQVVGVAQRDLMSGMGHNVGGYASDSQMMVRVSFLVSAGDQRAGFDPTQLRAYEVGKSKPILPTGALWVPACSRPTRRSRAPSRSWSPATAAIWSCAHPDRRTTST